ncbi:MAG: class I SAM-dependent methyltransferase [Candidatus Shapirobacteria bacterium]|nr:class I SAM-dependent methyltransferase [Candidatus Shapirobacteria bacterium]
MISNKTDYRKNAEEFWNDFENIKWFKNEPVPQYWIDFFKRYSGKNKSVLDLGCGAGRNTEVLFKLGFDTYACDLYKNMVSTTRKCLIGIGVDKKVADERVTLGDMLDIKFPDQYFDIVLSNGVFHNAYDLSELDKAIGQVSRVLKKNGHLCFNMFSSEKLESFKKTGDSVYVTKEGLVMTLITSQNFQRICLDHGLKAESPIVQYKREVSTGVRAVMRGIMVKD